MFDIKMDLIERCERIREIDVLLSKLTDEKDALYYDGLTIEQHNILFDMVQSDGKPHWI